MGVVIKVHHPDLTSEERMHRVEEIKKAVIKFNREVITNDEKNINSK